MTTDDLIRLLANVPFAILVAVYVLVRIVPILDKLEQTEAAELELMRIVASHILPAHKIPPHLRRGD